MNYDKIIRLCTQADKIQAEITCIYNIMGATKSSDQIFLDKVKEKEIEIDRFKKIIRKEVG